MHFDDDFYDVQQHTTGSFSESETYMRLYNKLRSIQTELNYGSPIQITLPQIVFCGNQSAGKSSVIEAISGIPLPRNNITTTRAKTELRMLKSEEPFKCIIKLKGEGQEVQFGPEITEKNQVELQVQRAQLALLNPKRSYSEFYNYPVNPDARDAEPDGQLQFTEDTLVLEISDPDVYNLTLLDIPGLISNHLIPENINLVEKVTENCLRDPNTIIVAVVSCTEDENLAKILSMARQYDPEGERTIAVLTKPDLVGDGDEGKIMAMIDTRSSSTTAPQLHLGYFVVRNRTQKELRRNISLEEARSNEDDYFRNTPWLADMRRDGRCGIEALKSKLSELLVEKLKAQLETIRHQCQIMEGNVQSKLEEIPQVKFESYEHLQELSGRRVHIFADKITNAVNTTTSNKSLWHDVLAEFRQFELDLYAERPVFESADGEIQSIELQGHQRRSNTYIEHDNDPRLSIKEGHFWSFDRVERTISDQRGLDPVRFDVTDAIRQIVKFHQDKWEIPTRRCVIAVHKVFSEFVTNTALEVFSGAYSNVAEKLCEILQNQLDEAQDKTLDLAVKRFFKMESPDSFAQSLFTMRENDFVDYLDDVFPLAQGAANILEKVCDCVNTLIRYKNLPAPKISSLVNHCRHLIKEWSILKDMLKLDLDARIMELIASIAGSVKQLTDVISNNTDIDIVKIRALLNILTPDMCRILTSIGPESLKNSTNTGRGHNLTYRMDPPTVRDKRTLDSIQSTHKVMAGVLSYYKIAHQRYLDNVCRSIFVIMLSDFAQELADNLFRQMGLLSGSREKAQVSVEDWEWMVHEDKAVTKKREGLERLRDDLRDIVTQANRLGRRR